MCSSTADTEILSEFHSGQSESLKSNEQSKISLSLRRTSGGDACKKPQFGQSARRRSQSVTRRGMSNDRFETEIRLGRAKRENRQTGFVTTRCLAKGIET
jgi:hypothetical protein